MIFISSFKEIYFMWIIIEQIFPNSEEKVNMVIKSQDSI